MNGAIINLVLKFNHDSTIIVLNLPIVGGRRFRFRRWWIRVRLRCPLRRDNGGGGGIPQPLPTFNLCRLQYDSLFFVLCQ